MAVPSKNQKVLLFWRPVCRAYYMGQSPQSVWTRWAWGAAEVNSTLKMQFQLKSLEWW